MNATTVSSANEAAILARANFESVVGEILLFLSGIPPYEEMFLEQIPNRIIRPLALKQFQIVRSEEGLIIGYTSWAMVTEELAERLRAGNMLVDEFGKDGWNCGDNKVVVDEIGMVNSVLDAFRKKNKGKRGDV